MATAALYSGGKDSTLAIHRVVASGINVDLLITFRSKNEFSYMFHYPNIEATKLQAQALGIKQIFVATEGIKEEELGDIEKALVNNNVTTLVTGAVASTYQKERIEAICKRHKIECISPLWRIDPETELRELAENFEVIITQVAAEGLDESFLGQRIDEKMIDRLKEVNKKYRINIHFEGGEAESFVLDAPLFKKKIKILESEKSWDKGVGRFMIRKAELIEKEIHKYP